jgi:myo-inositol 2-dehydrogenase / D-chiro-inositol 1-dehydrogenase
MSASAVPVALVGAGRMGTAHLRALRYSDRVRVVAVADPVLEARSRAEETFGVAAFPSLDRLLETGGFESAIVAAPSGLHLETVRRLTQERYHVLCEKPCGLRPDDAREAARLGRDAGVAVRVGYWRRFVPTLQALRERIRAGELGTLSSVSCFQWDERPPPAQFRAASGGIVLDMGVHELDMLRWLTGQEVAGVGGVASTVGVDPPVAGDPETVELVVALSEGTAGHVSLGRRFPPGDACKVEVRGTHGAEEIRFLWPPDGERVFLGALRAQAEAFVNAPRGELPGATADDAAAALDAAVLGSAAVAESGVPYEPDRR